MSEFPSDWIQLDLNHHLDRAVADYFSTAILQCIPYRNLCPLESNSTSSVNHPSLSAFKVCVGKSLFKSKFFSVSKLGF